MKDVIRELRYWAELVRRSTGNMHAVRMVISAEEIAVTVAGDSFPESKNHEHFVILQDPETEAEEKEARNHLQAAIGSMKRLMGLQEKETP